MATYLVLGKFTAQGVKDIRQLRQRVEENMQQARRLGMSPTCGWYLTMGQYDFVVIAEGPDDETMAAQALGVASRTETLRAFTLDDLDQILQKLGSPFRDKPAALPLR